MRILLKTIWSKFRQLRDKGIAMDDKVKCFLEDWEDERQRLKDTKLDRCPIRKKPCPIGLHIV